jgi:hypothetical protein
VIVGTTYIKVRWWKEAECGKEWAYPSGKVVLRGTDKESRPALG